MHLKPLESETEIINRSRDLPKEHVGLLGRQQERLEKVQQPVVLNLMEEYWVQFLDLS